MGVGELVIVSGAILLVPLSGLITWLIVRHRNPERAVERAALAALIAAIVLLGVGGLLIGLPAYFGYRALRKTDPEHALQRAAGLGFAVFGLLVLIVGAVMTFVSACQEHGPIIQTEFGPGWSNGSEMGSQALGPGVLSVWLLLAGAACAGGVLLFMRRFSLGLMLALIGAMAMMASVPQLVVEAHAPFGTITAYPARPPTPTEWASIKEALAKEAMLTAVAQKLFGGAGGGDGAQPSAGPLADIVADIELRRVHSVGSTVEDGVWLSIRFAESGSPPLRSKVFNALADEVERRLSEACQPEPAVP